MTDRNTTRRISADTIRKMTLHRLHHTRETWKRALFRAPHESRGDIQEQIDALTIEIDGRLARGEVSELEVRYLRLHSDLRSEMERCQDIAAERDAAFGEWAREWKRALDDCAQRRLESHQRCREIHDEIEECWREMEGER